MAPCGCQNSDGCPHGGRPRWLAVVEPLVLLVGEHVEHIARIDALNAQDDRRRGGLILLHGGYGHGGYRYPIFRASPLSRGNSAAADPNSGPLAPTVTVERFKGDFARSAFGHAARPNIAPIVRANAEYQRRFADAASRDEIIAPQRAVDAQVRGHKLEREPVDNH